MNFLEQLKLIWQKVGLVQRALLAAILVACGITAFLLTQWATQPEMRLLYKDLDPSMAAEITDKIRESEIPYELRSGGTSIYVPNEHVHQLRLDMAKAGLPGEDHEGYKIFDKEKLGVSPMVQQMNYNRAIQDELAKTIQMIEGVEYARVHIVRPEQTLFTTAPEEATASVILQLKMGWRLPQASIGAITNLVAGAVDGLLANNVTIVDSQGRMLTNNANDDDMISSANTFMDYKERVEQGIASKIQDMLEMVLGPNRSSVKISAVIDMTSQETMKTEYQKGIPMEETIMETSNIRPGETSEESGTTTGGSTEKDSTTETKLKLPETVTKIIEVPGQIQSLSVAAVVDLRSDSAIQTDVPADTDSENEQEAQPVVAVEKIMTVEQVKDIIRKAVGPTLLKEVNGEESISVIEAPFNRPSAAALLAPETNVNKFDQILQIVRHSSMGILSVCALLVLWIFSRAMKKPKTQTANRERPSIETLGLLPTGESAQQPIIALRQHIAGKFKENPNEVKTLFTSWLQEEA